MNQRLGKVFYQNVDDYDRVYISHETMDIDAMEVFYLHDDVDWDI